LTTVDEFIAPTGPLKITDPDGAEAPFAAAMTTFMTEKEAAQTESKTTAMTEGTKAMLKTFGIDTTLSAKYMLTDAGVQSADRDRDTLKKFDIETVADVYAAQGFPTEVTPSLDGTGFTTKFKIKMWSLKNEGQTVDPTIFSMVPYVTTSSENEARNEASGGLRADVMVRARFPLPLARARERQFPPRAGVHSPVLRTSADEHQIE